MTEQPQPLRIGFHREIAAIDQKVIRLFALVSEAVAAANEAFLSGDTDALAVVRAGESTIDELMVELEVDIERLLLLSGSAATAQAADAVLVARFYERLADHAVHIAVRVARSVA